MAKKRKDSIPKISAALLIDDEDEPDLYVPELPISTPDYPAIAQEDGTPWNPVDLIAKQALDHCQLLEVIINKWHDQKLGLKIFNPEFEPKTQEPKNFEAQLVRRLEIGGDLLHDVWDVMLGKDLKKVRQYWKQRRKKAKGGRHV